MEKWQNVDSADSNQNGRSVRTAYSYSNVQIIHIQSTFVQFNKCQKYTCEFAVAVLQTNQITKVSFAFEMWCRFAMNGSQWERERARAVFTVLDNMIFTFDKINLNLNCFATVTMLSGDYSKPKLKIPLNSAYKSHENTFISVAIELCFVNRMLKSRPNCR